MLKIIGNNIYLTRGDTLTLVLTLTKDGEAYEVDPDDSIRFAISTGYEGEVAYNLIHEQPVPIDTLQFTVASSVTKTLDYKAYNYDVEITHPDGAVDTVISGKLHITGEVK